MKKLLVVVDPGFESGKDQYLKRIVEAEGEIVCLTNTDQRVPIAPWWLKYVGARNVIPVSFRNPTLAASVLIEWATRNDVELAAFYTYFEEAVPVTNALAKHFGLIPISAVDILASRHKGRMRQQLTAFQIPQPKFFVCQSREEACEAVKQLGLPCVIKPAQFLASLGVLKLDSPDPKVIGDAFDAARSVDIAEEDTRYAYSLSPDVIVEEYLPADYEMTCEGIVQRGQLVDFFATGKLLGKEPHFVELVHWSPMQLSSSLKEELRRHLETSIAALGLYSCIVHAEFRVKNDSPVLIEMGARVAGGLIPLVVEEASSVDLLTIGTRLAKGEPNIHWQRRHDRFSCIFFLESSEQLEIAKTLGPGELTQYTTGDYFGHYRPTLSEESEIYPLAEKIYSV